MSQLNQTSLNIFNNFIKQRVNTLVQTPIKTLRKELREECLKKGTPDVKELSSLLSRERRRSKKVLYSADERRRNKKLMRSITTDVRSMLIEADSLREEISALEYEVMFYKTAVFRSQSEQTLTYFDNQNFPLWQDYNPYFPNTGY